MQRLEVSGAVRPIYGSLGVKRLSRKLWVNTSRTLLRTNGQHTIVCWLVTMLRDTHVVNSLCVSLSLKVKYSLFLQPTFPQPRTNQAAYEHDLAPALGVFDRHFLQNNLYKFVSSGLERKFIRCRTRLNNSFRFWGFLKCLRRVMELVFPHVLSFPWCRSAQFKTLRTSQKTDACSTVVEISHCLFNVIAYCENFMLAGIKICVWFFFHCNFSSRFFFSLCYVSTELDPETMVFKLKLPVVMIVFVPCT